MKVLLINPPVRRFVRFQMPSFPLGLGYITAILTKDGHKVAIYDAEWSTNIGERWEETLYPFFDMAKNWYKYSLALNNLRDGVWQEAERVIRQYYPDVIGITCRMLDLASALILARIAKSIRQDILVILGGPGATTCTDLILREENVDFAVRGEGEITMTELLREVQKSNPNYRLIDGLSFREYNNIVHNKERRLIEDISSLPFPARDQLLYADKLPRRMYNLMMGEMVTSRGCPYQCSFCANYSIWGSRRPRIRSPQDIVAEIIHQRDTYNIDYFLFWDDLFAINRDHTIKICNLLLEKRVDIRWACLVRADRIDEELLRLMKQAGCIQVQMGVESGSDRILKKMQKGITVAQIRNAAKMIRKIGIPWICFLLIGIPGETKEEMEDTMSLVPELKPNVAELSVFAPFPGSPLYEELREAGQLNDEDLSFADFLNVDYCYTGTMPQEEFRHLALKYLRFCDEYNRKMNVPPARYLYYMMRHPGLFTRKLVNKLFQVTTAYIRGICKYKARWGLVCLKAKSLRQKPDSLIRYLNYTIRINDGPSFYTLYKDIFIKRIYHFRAQRPDPFILDCGSNIGMSILYFKRVYPQARIIGFEPEPTNFSYLKENITRNGLGDVKLFQAALDTQAGTSVFHSGGKYASYLAKHFSCDMPGGWQRYEIPCVRLSDYLTEPVDFLKMNIEGAEYDVLKNSAECLRMVREMVIEYHHLPGLVRTLHKILSLLDDQGFEYLINDFDSETNIGVCPPFQLRDESRYSLLIYARRKD